MDTVSCQFEVHADAHSVSKLAARDGAARTVSAGIDTLAPELRLG